MQSAFLRGREHQKVGGLAVEAEGTAAVALSRGGARKTYHHTDPNEDCVAFALGEGGSLIVVADGHHGELGSEAAIETILEEFSSAWTSTAPPAQSPAEWHQLGLDAVEGANRAILEIAGKNQLPPAPTTFALALLRPAENFLLHVSVGDSHLFAVDSAKASDLGGGDPAWKFTPFLGYEQANRETIEKYTQIGVRDLDGLQAIVLATDGLSEPGIGVADPTNAVFEQVAQATAEFSKDRRPVETCRGVVETAMRAHLAQKAGDNMGCAVVWLDAPAD
ncbi:MAG: PP2C family serine/threonine-protein phosphatase [Myxococcota bacterium]